MKTARGSDRREDSRRAPTEPIDCTRAAEIRRRADSLLTPNDREEIASGIEEARRRMNNEHLQ